MQFFHAILGAVVLLFGRPLYWLAVGVLGFLAGAQIADTMLADKQLFVQLLAAVGAGVIGAILAVIFQRVAFAIGGFFAGAYLAQGMATSFGISSNYEAVWFVLLGVIGAVIAALVMDWAIIVMTSLVGAGAIVTALSVSQSVSALLFVVLTARRYRCSGLAIQPARTHAGAGPLCTATLIACRPAWQSDNEAERSGGRNICSPRCPNDRARFCDTFNVRVAWWRTVRRKGICQAASF